MLVDAPDKSTYEQLETRNAELEEMLIQIITAAHFEQTNEDYFLPDRVRDLFALSQQLPKVVAENEDNKRLLMNLVKEKAALEALRAAKGEL